MAAAVERAVCSAATTPEAEEEVALMTEVLERSGMASVSVVVPS